MGGDGGRDQLALQRQRLALRVDQPSVVLAEIVNAADHDDETDEVGSEDEAKQTAGDEAHGLERENPATNGLADRRQPRSSAYEQSSSTSQSGPDAFPGACNSRGPLRL